MIFARGDDNNYFRNDGQNNGILLDMFIGNNFCPENLFIEIYSSWRSYLPNVCAEGVSNLEKSILLRPQTDDK